MESSSNPKPKNILIRHSSLTQMRVDSTYQHPENFHLLKYFPKYYKNLGLHITNHHPLLSKIKGIKKLERFTGCFKNNLPKSQWFKLLGNNRKEMKEIPETILSRLLKLSKHRRARLTLGNLKFFVDTTRISLSIKRGVDNFEDLADFSNMTNPSLRYLRNMRKLKALDIYLARKMSLQEIKWMFGKLEGMDWLLSRLQTLRVETDDNIMSHLQLLYKHQKICSHLTGLRFSEEIIRFYQGFELISQTFKNLKLLSIDFECNVTANLLAAIQGFPGLANLEIGLPKGVGYYWSSFKPQQSLRYLKLKLSISDFIQEGFFGPQTKPEVMKNLLGHWEVINELECLEFDISCESIAEILSVRSFITTVLKKVKNVTSLKCSIDVSVDCYDEIGEPFFVEDISHLYESLERFEYILKGETLSFDFKIMKGFVNLKEFKLNGKRFYYENIEDILDLLQGNQPSAGLELTAEVRNSPEWLEETLKKISLVKRADRNLKIKLDLEFKTRNLYESEVDFLGKLCEVMKSDGKIKGLSVDVTFDGETDCFVNKEELQG